MQPCTAWHSTARALHGIVAYDLHLTYPGVLQTLVNQIWHLWSPNSYCRDPRPGIKGSALSVAKKTDSVITELLCYSSYSWWGCLLWMQPGPTQLQHSMRSEYCHDAELWRPAMNCSQPDIHEPYCDLVIQMWNLQDPKLLLPTPSSRQLPAQCLPLRGLAT